VEFTAAVPGGAIVGWETGSGTPALILHDGPASDNTGRWSEGKVRAQ
jgi:hypothetical protein